MNKVCTDITQSEKLLELGIDPDTADMYWRELTYSDPKRYRANVREDGMMIESPVVAFPAWSLTALLNLMPNGIEIVKDEVDTKEDIYMCCIDTEDNVSAQFFADNPLDVAFKMVYWLLLETKRT